MVGLRLLSLNDAKLDVLAHLLIVVLANFDEQVNDRHENDKLAGENHRIGYDIVQVDVLVDEGEGSVHAALAFGAWLAAARDQIGLILLEVAALEELGHVFVATAGESVSGHFDFLLHLLLQLTLGQKVVELLYYVVYLLLYILFDHVLHFVRVHHAHDKNDKMESEQNANYDIVGDQEATVGTAGAHETKEANEEHKDSESEANVKTNVNAQTHILNTCAS